MQWLNLFKSKEKRISESRLLKNQAAIITIEWTDSSKLELLYETIIKYYYKAILLDPDDPEPYWSVIEILHWQGKNQKALEYYLKIPSNSINDYELTNTLPILIGMLISVELDVEAEDVLVWSKNQLFKGLKESEDLLLLCLPLELQHLTFENGLKFYKLIDSIYPNSNLKWISEFYIRSKGLFEYDEYSEAIKWIDVAITLKSEESEGGLSESVSLEGLLDFKSEIVKSLEKKEKEIEQNKNKYNHNYQYEKYKELRKEIEFMPIYKRWRESVMGKCNHICQMCGSNKNLQIHHLDSFYKIIKQHRINSIEEAFECKQLWSIDNGEVLCKECHDKMDSSQNRQNYGIK